MRVLCRGLSDFRAFEELRIGSHDGSAGQGADTRDPLHGVSEDTLAAAARAATPVDPEWGDWSNPKAHALVVSALTAEVRETVHDAGAFEVASAINKFL